MKSIPYVLIIFRLHYLHHASKQLRMAMGRVSPRPATTRPAPFRDPPQKTRLLSRPVCFNGTRLTRPDGT